MAGEDAELGVMLEVDDSQLEDIEDRQVDVEANVEDGEGVGTPSPAGAGGETVDLSPAQQEQQEGIVAGGVSKGLLAAGILGGILSQLKAISGIINAVFGAISRALVPVVEKVAEFLRPIIQGVNELAELGFKEFGKQQGEETAGEAGIETGGRVLPPDQQLEGNAGQTIVTEEGEKKQLLTPGGVGRFIQENPIQAVQNGFNSLIDTFSDPAKSSDQSGEQTKKKAKNDVEDALGDKTGGGG